MVIVKLQMGGTGHFGAQGKGVEGKDKTMKALRALLFKGPG